MHVGLEVADFTISFQKNPEKNDDLIYSPKKDVRKFSEVRGDDDYDAGRSKSMWEELDEEHKEFYEPPKFFIIDGRIVQIPY